MLQGRSFEGTIFASLHTLHACALKDPASERKGAYLRISF